MRPRTSSGLVDTIFWLSVVGTVMMSWSACASNDNDALTMAFVIGAVGLITFLIAAQQEG